MIAGLEEISRGTVAINGRVVNDVPPKDRDIAMVFQNYALYPHMTVYDNMAFALKLRGVAKAEIERRVREAAEILEITDYLARRPKELSGGQRQRVAVGRAIVRKPAVFLFDEPLSNLDAKMRVQMRAEISKLHRRLEATMIYVTHDQIEAMTMADRIVVMKDGRIQQVAVPGELYARPANTFVGGFIGTPPMNFFSGTLRQAKDGALVFDEGGFTLPVHPAHRERLAPHAGRELVCGLRPEHLAPVADTAMPGTFSAMVEVVEPTGPETFVYLHTGKHPFIARVAPETRCRPGDKLALAVRTDEAHYFERENTAAL
jgi:multiple sugar transport system ATP-binding protein